MKVLVASGGTSSERDISLLSGRAVIKAGETAGYDMTFYDWDGSEDWLLAHAKDFEVILPIQHGTGSEDGTLQKILEKAGVPFLGSGSEASAICFDKGKTLKILEAKQIKVPEGSLTDAKGYRANMLFNRPHVLKPVDSGSSIDTFIYPDPTKKNLDEIDDAFDRHGKMLLEEYIDGIEISVPVLEGKLLPVVEIVPPDNEHYDFENKYNGKSQHLIPPVHVNNDMQAKSQRLGVEVHQILGCRHLSRTDMIVKGGKLYVLETNTMPGMTGQSLLPHSAAVAGMNYPDLVDYFIKLTLGRL